jgi:hypothetical protein
VSGLTGKNLRRRASRARVPKRAIRVRACVLAGHTGRVRKLRGRIEDYLDYRAGVWALLFGGVALAATALVLLLVLPHPSAVGLAGIFGVAIIGSWMLRTGFTVNRERKEAARASTPESRDIRDESRN